MNDWTERFRFTLFDYLSEERTLPEGLLCRQSEPFCWIGPTLIPPSDQGGRAPFGLESLRGGLFANALAKTPLKRPEPVEGAPQKNVWHTPCIDYIGKSVRSIWRGFYMRGKLGNSPILQGRRGLNDS